jgi:hypothetical protein
MSRFALALGALVTAGCAETVFRSGLPAGEVPKGYDRRWHDALFFGAVEPAEPAPLTSICPLGWSEVRVTPTFAAAAVGWVTFGIYTPSTVTVVCAAPPGVYIGAPGEVPLPPMCR